MAVSLDNAEENRPLNQDNAESNDIENSCVACDLDSITVNVFFDGTGNNMFNTQHRLDDEKLIDEEYRKRNIPSNISEEEKNKIREQIRQEVTPYGNLKGQISYDNDLSNIALLYNAAEIDTCTKRVYIEGAGTLKDEADDQGGLAAGTGESGIMDRTFDAFSQTRKQIKEQKASMIIFNIFGFSRGAFYGRYFAAVLKEEFTDEDEQKAQKEATKKELAAQKREERNKAAVDKRIEHQQNPPSAFKQTVINTAKTVGSIVFAPITALYKIANNKLPFTDSIPILTNDYDWKCNGRALLNYQPEEIIINLVGIYDTVASHGWDHHNDSIPFKLDIGAKQEIKKIIHLTAKNEYRNHFALVTINTAIKDRNSDGNPIGFQCAVPGAHADTGGGYIKDWAETNQYLSNYDRPDRTGLFTTDAGEVNWRWFRDQGYYGYGAINNTYTDITATRSSINKLEQEITDRESRITEDKAQEIENPKEIEALALAKEKLATQQKELTSLYALISPSSNEGNKEVETTAPPTSPATTNIEPNSTEPATDEDSVLLKRDGYRSGDFIVNRKRALNLQAYYEVRGNRTLSENAYQYIPLKMMHHMAKDSYIEALKFINYGINELNSAYTEIASDPILSKFCNYAVNTSVKNYVAYTGDMLNIDFKDANLQDTESRYLYHNFIHNSLKSEFSLKGIADYLANGSRDYNKDDHYNPVRVIVYDNEDGVQNAKPNNPYTNGASQETGDAST